MAKRDDEQYRQAYRDGIEYGFEFCIKSLRRGVAVGMTCGNDFETAFGFALDTCQGYIRDRIEKRQALENAVRVD